MSKISLVVPYYNQPLMLQEHLKRWRDIEGVEFIIIDDGSKDRARNVKLPNIDIKIYEILEDKYFNQHGARNLGAKVASNEWLLMNDMDHEIPKETFKFPELDKECFYKFKRRFVDGRKLEIAPNIFLMHKDAYWDIGGYDEDFVNELPPCDDSWFIKMAKQKLKDIYLNSRVIVWTRGDVPDADIRKPQELRQKGRDKFEEIKKKKERGELSSRPVNPIRFPWKRVI